MFPREQRLRSGKEIIFTLRRGNRRSAGPIACSFIGKPGMLGRSTVIVDSKVAKRATERNLLKRRVRTVLLEHSVPAGDLVVRLYKGSEQMDFATLRSQLLVCLQKLSSG